MKINKRDFLNLKVLLEEKTITQGKFINKKIIEGLKLNGSVCDGKKSAKVRYINLLKAENIFIFLKNSSFNIESIEDIDRYIDEVYDNKPSRDTIQKWHNNGKAVDSKSLRGLYISSLNSVNIKVNNELVTIIPNSGIGYFLFYTQKVGLDKDTIVVGIENYQVVWFAKKYQEFFQSSKILFVVINPYMLEWIKSIENEYIHFGDYDLAGISIYLDKIIPRLLKSKKYSMFIPENIEELIQKHGDTQLYKQQIESKHLTVKDKKIESLIKIIDKYKKGIEQEGLYLLCKNHK